MGTLHDLLELGCTSSLRVMPTIMPGLRAWLELSRALRLPYVFTDGSALGIARFGLLANPWVIYPHHIDVQQQRHPNITTTLPPPMCVLPHTRVWLST